MSKEIGAAGFEERRFDTGEVVLNYVVGPDNGPPLVLIPAQMGTWESYRKVLPPLARRFRAYAVDVRGHGGSGWTTGEYSWECVGRDLSAFLERVVGSPAIVSGNSSGGLIALWLAANRPELVSGIVLEDAPVFSAEMPRFRDRDRFVYEGLRRMVEAIGNPETGTWPTTSAAKSCRGSMGGCGASWGGSCGSCRRSSVATSRPGRGNRWMCRTFPRPYGS